MRNLFKTRGWPIEKTPFEKLMSEPYPKAEKAKELTEKYKIEQEQWEKDGNIRNFESDLHCILML